MSSADRWIAVRLIGYVVVAAAGVVACVLMYRHGVRTSVLSGFTVRQYSGPWIAGSMSVLGLALLALTLAGVHLARRLADRRH